MLEYLVVVGGIAVSAPAAFRYVKGVKLPKKLHPKKLLPFYAKPPALVNSKDVLVGMVVTELLRPDITLLRTPKKPRYEIGCDNCRRHSDGKFEIQWRDRGQASTLGRYADVSLLVMGEQVLLTEKGLALLKDALEKLNTFERERAKLEDEAAEQQKACDLIDKWCGIDSTKTEEDGLPIKKEV